MNSKITLPLLAFTKYIFKLRTGDNFIENWHHVYICDILEQVYHQKLENVIINLPYESSATEIVSIAFPLWCTLNSNTSCRFINREINTDNAKYTDSRIQAVLDDPKFDSTKLHTNLDYISSSIYDELCGTRAGYMTSGFNGAYIINSPIKSMYDTYPNKYKEVYTRLDNNALNTARNRRAHTTTPIILITPRQQEQDMTAIFLNSEIGNSFTHIIIPAILNFSYISNYPQHIQDIIIRDNPNIILEPISFWKQRISKRTLVEIEQVSPIVFLDKYMQRTGI